MEWLNAVLNVLTLCGLIAQFLITKSIVENYRVRNELDIDFLKGEIERRLSALENKP